MCLFYRSCTGSLYHLKNIWYSVLFKRGGEREENLAKKVLGTFPGTLELHATHTQPASQEQGPRNGCRDPVGQRERKGHPPLWISAAPDPVWMAHCKHFDLNSWEASHLISQGPAGLPPTAVRPGGQVTLAGLWPHCCDTQVTCL